MWHVEGNCQDFAQPVAVFCNPAERSRCQLLAQIATIATVMDTTVAMAKSTSRLGSTPFIAPSSSAFIQMQCRAPLAAC
jgi:hypothetical protein